MFRRMSGTTIERNAIIVGESSAMARLPMGSSPGRKIPIRQLEPALALLMLPHDASVGAATDRLVGMVEGAIAGEDRASVAVPPLAAGRG